MRFLTTLRSINEPVRELGPTRELGVGVPTVAVVGTLVGVGLENLAVAGFDNAAVARDDTGNGLGVLAEELVWMLSDGGDR